MTAVKASVVIPVKNGGALLDEVVRAVLAQQPTWPFELLVIDSGSTDGSLACLEGTSARLIPISSQAFNHGDTRNLGAREARGEYVVFLVADATPVDDRWLERLVEGLEACSEAVAGYARQRARSDADAVLRRRIDAWTPPLPAPLLKRVASIDAFRALPPIERLRLAAFDNVCSVVRRAHLLEHPFPAVPFGEDICWGEAQLLAGHGLVYIPGAEVWHSHRRSFGEHVRRSRLEHRMLSHRFGLRTVPTLRALVLGTGKVCVSRLRDGGDGLAREVAELVGQYLGGRPGPD